MREQPHKPRVNTLVRDPNRWGPVDLIIAMSGGLSFVTLLVSSAYHYIMGIPL